MRLTASFALAATLLVSATACMDTSSPELPPLADPATTTYAPALGIDLAAMTKSTTGLYVRDDVVGTGADVANDQAASVKYKGWISSGSSFDAGTLNFASFPLMVANDPTSRVIPGFEEGVRGMKVGGKRTIVIPPQLGYGYTPLLGIPANSVLIFSIELLGVQ